MQNYKKICDLLSSDECKGFVNKFLHLNPAQIALQYRDKLPCDASILALIVQLYQKGQQKLPAWVQNYCALTAKSFEQSTSQTVALYKTTFMQGTKLLVLGGGLGVDEWALANTFNQITSIDNDAELNEIVAFNAKRLGFNNCERLTQTAETFLQNTTDFFDCIYTDPDRRDGQGARKITLQHSTPDIIGLLPTLWLHTKKLVIKASPVIDIKDTAKQLGFVSEVRVIALENEVKEVLFTVEKDFAGLHNTIATNFTNNGWQEIANRGETLKPTNSTMADCFFYEPNLAIIKANLHQHYAAQMGLGFLDEKTAYYTSPQKVNDFMGRVFSIKAVIPFTKKSIATYLKQHKIAKANIAKRNFRLSVDELKKMFTIKDGGEDYLFFTQLQGKPFLYHCTK